MIKLNEKRNISFNTTRIFNIFNYEDEFDADNKKAKKIVQAKDYELDLTKIGKSKILRNVHCDEIWHDYCSNKSITELNVCGFRKEWLSRYKEKYIELLEAFHKELPQLTKKQLIFGVNNVLFKNEFTGLFVEEMVKKDLAKEENVVDSGWYEDYKHGVDFYLNGKKIQVKSSNWFKNKVIKYENQINKYKDCLFIVYTLSYKTKQITYEFKTFSELFNK